MTIRMRSFVLKSLYVTEKSKMLEGLVDNSSNRCVEKCKNVKYTFLIFPSANKIEVKKAVEEMYKDQNIHVEKVNIIFLPSKKKRMKGRKEIGYTTRKKKAIVTLRAGEEIDFEV